MATIDGYLAAHGTGPASDGIGQFRINILSIRQTIHESTITKGFVLIYVLMGYSALSQ